MKNYLLHLRPQSFPVTFFAVITGYALSPEKPGEVIEIVKDLGVLFLIFSVLLWGGTNAFNSGQDGNEGPLTLLPNPPRVPKHLSIFGFVLMSLAVAFSFFISLRLACWTSIGVLLSLFYSWKNPFFKRGKDIPVVDMLINTIGFGFCSILFGYLVTDAAITSTVMLVGVGFTFAYLGGMPTSQIFQLNETLDTTNNYTTLFGVENVLKLGAVFFLLHLAFLGFAFTDITYLKTHPVALSFWFVWFILVFSSAVHSFWWSRTSYKNPYKRMNRQMIMMMGSQIAWTVYAWLENERR
ncbi:MAG: UbiA family prenyltransferase [Bacteroidota bacterium]|nr:UbiA family prenyltransferase [Bacteroidota bacterium]